MKSGRRGYILAWVLIIIMVLMGIGVGLLELSRVESIQVVKDQQRLKALNIAEGGVERTLWKLKNTADWRTGYLNQQLGDGAYSVAIAALPQTNWYRLTSTGTVNGVSKTVTLDTKVEQTRWPIAFDYGLFWGNVNNMGQAVTVQNNCVLNGNVFGKGNLVFQNNSAVNGTVYATGTVSGNGSYTKGANPDPLPDNPVANVTPYDNMIATANQQTAANFTVGNNATYNLSGGTMYVKGNVTLNNNSTLNGPGKVVATGNITLSNNVTVTGNVDFIAGGTLQIANNGASVGGDGNILYSRTAIVIRNNVNVGVKTTLYCPNTIEINNNARVTGAVWGGTVTMGNNAQVRGAAYASVYFNAISNNFTLNYDATVLALNPPQGIALSQPRISLTIGAWHEQAASGC